MSKNTNLSFLTDYITADITNGRIGINNASPAYAFDVTGIARTSTSTYLATSGGNVGIGTSSPTRLLDVSAAGTAYIRTSDTTNSVNVDMLSASSGGWIGTQSNHSFQLQTNNTERMRITSAGNVGIGTSNPAGYYSNKLVVFGANEDGITIANDGSNGSNYLQFANGTSGAARYNGGIGYNHTNNNLTFYTNSGNNRMQITGDGNILMGTTSNNGERLYVSGSIRATGTITANSDISLKKNLLKIENALEKVEQINGYTYELKADDSKRHAGVIAQEIQTVLPEIVNTGNDGLMGVEYGNISALLIEAIKELSAEITILKNK